MLQVSCKFTFCNCHSDDATFDLLCDMQTLRRRIDVLSKQKSDIKASLAAAKSSCDSKAGDNDSLKSQIKVSRPLRTVVAMPAVCDCAMCAAHVWQA